MNLGKSKVYRSIIRVVAFVAVVIGVVGAVIIPNGFWFLNSSLTQMQLIIKFWHLYPLGFFSIACGLFILTVLRDD